MLQITPAQLLANIDISPPAGQLRMSPKFPREHFAA